MVCVRVGLRLVFGGLVVLVLVLLVGVAGAFAAGDVNVLACGNEAFLGFSPLLPDCRAYEQVTPRFKDGAPLEPVSISADGSRFLLATYGVFAGVESALPRSFYVLSRSGSGWQPAAVSPPVSGFPAIEFLGASPGLERTLWVARPPSQSVSAENFYVREADGAMTEIGPVFPASATKGPPAGEEHRFFYLIDTKFHAASDDLSHVVFSLVTRGPLWPGDTTNKPEENGVNTSLYEYAGVGSGEPELVGVSDGNIEFEGKLLPAGELISNCETQLGSHAGDTYNALSADGETVYFTAIGHNVAGCSGGVRAPEVSELYARIGGFRTVGISEPTLGQCEVCSVVEKKPAAFAGASEDGSQAFFLTEQELFAGARSMNLYEYDFNAPAGQKVTLVSSGSSEPEVQGVARVSEDGSHVYFLAHARLTAGPREGQAGKCLAGLAAGELAEEEAALVQEEKSEEVTHGARCRPRKGGDNLYVYEHDQAFPGGHLAFLATLAPADAEDWGAVDGRPVQASGDGRFLVFESQADLTAGDESSVGQVFEYDAQSEELVRVSVAQEGYAQGAASASSNASLIDSQAFEERMDSPAGADTSLALSGDGATVVFFSAGALTPGAVAAEEAGANSVYEYHSTVAGGGSISHGEVYLLSDGRDDSQVPGGFRGDVPFGVDVSGGDVFFQSFDALVAGVDGDSQFGLFDARVGGGFPVVAAPGGCEGEACYGPVSVNPAGATGGGAGVLGGGALLAAAPGGVLAGGQGGAVKRRVVCVRRRGRGRAGHRGRGGGCVRAAARRGRPVAGRARGRSGGFGVSGDRRRG
jgi:hypothetical protein